MSLPPGFLDDLRARTSLSAVVARKVAWDLKKSNQGRGDMWAPCPFHQEKSASFHVDDRKGFYYCFGCHAKGDAVSFVKETENVGFLEAVEILAREAGMAMPARDPVARERADRRGQLAGVLEEAEKWFRLQLRTGAAAEARAYLDKRRLPEPAQERWGIGWAPDQGQALFRALTGRGIAADLVIDAGLCARPDDGRAPYDRFRGRIIFPIRDARGRVVSFGGRALDPKAPAKYLNGPETEVFDKGRTLFNLGPAREAAGKGAPLILAEGYMDVIALSEAGFPGAVAPMGTAITEDQLRLAWRAHPEPVVALDGDAAGFRAALRIVDLALPLLEAGRALRFATLPAGLDPDDLIRSQGPAAMQAVLDEAQPMVAVLWRREIEGRVFDSPERKAALDRALRLALDRIRDPGIRAHYAEDLRRLRHDLFGDPRRRARRPADPRQSGAFEAGRGRRFERPAPPPGPSLRLSALAGPATEAEAVLEAVLLGTLLTHPTLVAAFEADLEEVDFVRPDHDALRRAILRHAEDPARLPGKVAAEAGPAVDRLMAERHVQAAPCVRNAADTGLARMCLAEGLAKLEARRSVRQEIADAIEDVAGLPDEGLTWRLSQAAEALERAGRTPLDAMNDTGEDPAALSRHLQALIDGRIWVKKRT